MGIWFDLDTPGRWGYHTDVGIRTTCGATVAPAQICNNRDSPMFLFHPLQLLHGHFVFFQKAQRSVNFPLLLLQTAAVGGGVDYCVVL